MRSNSLIVFVQQVVLQWALQVGIVPLVGPRQRAHMEDDLAVSKAVAETMRVARCNQSALNDRSRHQCDEEAVQEQVALLEDRHLHAVQSIGDSPPEGDGSPRRARTSASKQRKRQLQRQKFEPLGEPMSGGQASVDASNTNQKKRLVVQLDDQAA